MSNTNWKRWGAAGGLVLLAAGYVLRRRHPLAPQPKQIAPGVWCLETGHAFMEANVYFVRSGSSWVLIDAGWPNCSQLIKEAAQSVFGAGSGPAAIGLTHIHADHSGSAAELARLWGCPVYVPPDELPLAAPGDLATVEQYANPLDRWLILPLLRAMPRRRVESMLSDTSLRDVTRAFERGGAVPCLPEWVYIPTPGHTPGHISFFRESDRMLIAGDALLTVNLNSLWDFVLQKQQVSGPPYISTWNWQAAQDSIAVLAKLEPRVIASGHGIPMTGPDAAQALCAFADRSGVGRQQQPARAPLCSMVTIRRSMYC
jgi:glyoxylase-like metal-dependent hydrolase (beta-lactamase superfamily II)